MRCTPTTPHPTATAYPYWQGKPALNTKNCAPGTLHAALLQHWRRAWAGRNTLPRATCHLTHPTSYPPPFTYPPACAYDSELFMGTTNRCQAYHCGHASIRMSGDGRPRITKPCSSAGAACRRRAFISWRRRTLALVTYPTLVLRLYVILLLR